MALTSFRTLGRSGLVVSPLSLGTMTFGQGGWGADEQGAREIFNAYRAAGGNFIDTADIYSGGTSEEIVGRFVNHMEVQAHNIAPGFDLPKWLTERGHQVVETATNRDHQRAAPIMLFTCVEAVKRIIGLHDWRVLTPWQLYRRLATAT